MNISRRGFLKGSLGLISAAVLPVFPVQAITDTKSSVVLNVIKLYRPDIQAWIYSFSTRDSIHHFEYTELSSEEMSEERFNEFKLMAIKQIEKIKNDKM